MKSQMPPFLKPGDKIGLTCTARSISLDQIQSTIKQIESHGYEIALGSSVGQVFHQFGGNDALRAESFQALLDDDSIKAIWVCRGGYGTIRIMDRLNFSHFNKKPKWILGYSDVTVLHNYIAQNTNSPSIHCMMPSEMDVNTTDSIENTFKVISGATINYKFDTNKNQNACKLKGRLIGGNLSILYSLIGGKYDIDTSDVILFIEDIDEYVYHVDRMMYALQHAGKLSQLKGLIVGGLTDMNDHDIPFGWNGQQIIENHIHPLNIPLLFDFPFGHMKNNLPILLNHECKISVSKGVTSFQQN